MRKGGIGSPFEIFHCQRHACPSGRLPKLISPFGTSSQAPVDRDGFGLDADRILRPRLLPAEVPGESLGECRHPMKVRHRVPKRMEGLPFALERDVQGVLVMLDTQFRKVLREMAGCFKE